MKQASWDSLSSDPALVLLKDLSEKVTQLASDAELDANSFPALADPDWLVRVFNRTASSFTVIVIGQVSSGKSSFINSLFGRKLLRPSDSPTDGVVSVLQSVAPGEPECAEKILHDGTTVRFDTITDAKNFLRQQETSQQEQLNCREVRLYLDEPWLRHLRIINTPGLGDRLHHFESAALRYLHEEESDLVVWTFFPDAAGNEAEIGLFADALARRRDAVIGVVTRCLENKNEDYDYEPALDPDLTGKDGVGPWLKQNLGKYLHELIFYDSHVARRLVKKMRDEPELQSDDTFVARLRRSGYARFEETMTAILGTNRGHVDEARVRSLLGRCRGHAMDLAATAQAAEAAFLNNEDVAKKKVAAWKKIEQDVIDPWRARLKDEIRGLSQERSKELVTVMGRSAADAIQENFKLVSTLSRSVVSWTGICNSAADTLNDQIGSAIKEALSRARFYERVDEALWQLLDRQLRVLYRNLEQAEQEIDGFAAAELISVDTGRPAGGAGDILGDALSGALKGVVSAILTSVADKLAKPTAAQSAKQATKTAATKATTAAAKEGAGATTAKAAGLFTLVLIPFDIKKLVADFRKGKKQVENEVYARYQADRPIYEIRIFDALWGETNRRVSNILEDAANLVAPESVSEKHFAHAQAAVNARQRLEELTARLAERTRGSINT